jgi:hypothetical protein
MPRKQTTPPKTRRLQCKALECPCEHRMIPLQSSRLPSPHNTYLSIAAQCLALFIMLASALGVEPVDLLRLPPKRAKAGSAGMTGCPRPGTCPPGTRVKLSGCMTGPCHQAPIFAVILPGFRYLPAGVKKTADSSRRLRDAARHAVRNLAFWYDDNLRFCQLFRRPIL